jgi:acyl carrier protein
MSFSPRTPEGFPSRCPLCGVATNIEFSDPGRDAPCPGCGCLLWRSSQLLEWFRSTLAEQLGVAPQLIDADSSLFVDDLGSDSLDAVELVMEWEEGFDLAIPDADAERIRTVGDLIRYLQKREREEGTQL